MIINGWLFFWLVVFAVIGVLCLGLGIALVGWLLWEARKNDLEMKRAQEKIEQARNQEYEGMKQVLLNYRFDQGQGQGAKV